MHFIIYTEVKTQEELKNKKAKHKNPTKLWKKWALKKLIIFILRNNWYKVKRLKPVMANNDLKRVILRMRRERGKKRSHKTKLKTRNRGVEKNKTATNIFFFFFCFTFVLIRSFHTGVCFYLRENKKFHSHARLPLVS